MASAELAAKLERRKMSCELTESDVPQEKPRKISTSVGFRALDFPEFTVKEIKQLETLFKRNSNDGVTLEFETLKSVLQKLGWPQTHLQLKKLLQSLLHEQLAGDLNAEKTAESDQNFRIELPTNSIDFRTFMLLFRKLKSGEVKDDAIAGVLASVQEIDVHEAGVGGAVNFFQAKVNALNRGASFEQEIREMREAARKEEADKKERKAAFREKQSLFNSIDSGK